MGWQWFLKLKDISTLDFSTPDFPTMIFSTMNFGTMGLKSSWLKNLGLKSPGLKCHLSGGLKEISSPDFSTPWFKNSWLKSPWLKSSWLKILGLKGPGLKLGVYRRPKYSAEAEVFHYLAFALGRQSFIVNIQPIKNTSSNLDFNPLWTDIIHLPNTILAENHTTRQNTSGKVYIQQNRF